MNYMQIRPGDILNINICDKSATIGFLRTRLWNL